MTNEQHSHQTEAEAIDWLYVTLGVAVIVALVLAAVTGHHWASVGVMP